MSSYSAGIFMMPFKCLQFHLRDHSPFRHIIKKDCHRREHIRGSQHRPDYGTQAPYLHVRERGSLSIHWASREGVQNRLLFYPEPQHCSSPPRSSSPLGHCGYCKAHDAKWQILFPKQNQLLTNTSLSAGTHTHTAGWKPRCARYWVTWPSLRVLSPVKGRPTVSALWCGSKN